jgi:hypothetical protein
MYNFYSTKNAVQSMQALTQLATAYQTMATFAGEVFLRRSLMMASGSMSVLDTVNIMVEKLATSGESAGEATAAAVKGQDPVSIASAALGPYGRQTEANVRELRG